MKKRLIALLLALIMVASLCAVSAAAGEQAVEKTEEPVVSEAGPDGEIAVKPEVDKSTEGLIKRVSVAPEKLEKISFGDVESRMREKNLNVLAMDESLLFLENIDYEDWQDDLRKILNQIADGQSKMLGAAALPEDDPYHMDLDTYAYGMMEQNYASLRSQFDAIKDGDLQKDNAGAMRQIHNLQDQIVMGGESLYIVLAGLKVQETALQRQLTALNRTVEEMELRYKLGQISAMQLAEVKSGRTALVSGLQTLQMNIKTYTTQLEMLLGAEMTGELTLGAVPEVTEQQLDAMDLENDLLTAKAKSYEIYAAAKTLEDAQETYRNVGLQYGFRESEILFQQAMHTWQADQYAYNTSILNYEYRFRQLYAQVQDYRQILNAAKVSLESEKSSCAASELKYQQGTISENAYLTAQDERKAAEEAVQTASYNLFSAYNSYCWAVQHGILN